MSTPATFSVTLHHLAADAARSDAGLPDVEFADVTSSRLRALLEGLVKLAPSVAYPAAPELRIVAPAGRFLVQVKEGRIRFTSWSLRTGGSELTPAQMLAVIAGEEIDDRSSTGPETARARKGMPRAAALGLLAAIIIGSNSVTAWMLTRPPRDLLPPYRLLGPEPAQRLLAEVAGTYETGSAEGDRQLVLKPEGAAHWLKFGPNRAAEEETDLTVQGAQSADRPALLTSTRALIEIKDATTVVFYGDTYRRKLR